MSAIRAVRSAEGKFVQLANSAGQDPRLSLEARGIIYFVLSLPPDKHFTAEWLETQVPNGHRVVRAALRELESYGYFSRTRKSAGRGKWVWDQVISDAPIDGAAPMQFPGKRQPLSPAAKELAQESAARARAARRDAPSSSNPVSDETTCDDAVFPQVSSSSKGSSDEKLPDKDLKTGSRSKNANTSSSARARETPCTSENIDVVVEDPMMTGMVISTLKFLTGQDVDENWASLQAYDILSKAKDPVVTHPRRFVKRALVNVPDARVFLPGYEALSSSRRRGEHDWGPAMARATLRERELGLGSQSYPDEAYYFGIDGKPLPSAPERNEDPVLFGQIVNVRRGGTLP